MGLTPKGQDSQENLATTALRLFRQRGFHGVSISDVCQAAGVTKGALYHHFKSKEELYYRAVGLHFNDLAALPAWIERIPENRIEELIRSGFASILESKKAIASRVGSSSDDAILRYYTFLYEATRRFPEFQQRIDAYDAQKQAELARRFRLAQQATLMRADINPEALAMEFEALLQQLTYLSFVNPRLKGNPEILASLQENFLLRVSPA
ncbi:MAG: TetR/AcrR family transcriptional regulator [Spirochaetales bacterium]|nr:TetR/AcrR family transcriptional regulator [Spirochaetales bacterium]